MIEPRLFVSDLDGTLLQADSTLSPYATRQLTELIHQGVLFTVATARSITSIRQVLPNSLPLHLPVICSNGAYLADFRREQRMRVNSVAKPLDEEILDFLLTQGFHPFVGSWDGSRDHLMLGQVLNQGMSWYRDDRMAAKDPRLQFVSDVRQALPHQIISINVIDHHEIIFPLADALRQSYRHHLQLYTYQNWQGAEWYWLSMYAPEATKGNALAYLCAELGIYPEECMVFGDNLNDISMFEWAGHTVAVANAHQELFPLAETVISSNETDSVVKYIRKRVLPQT